MDARSSGGSLRAYREIDRRGVGGDSECPDTRHVSRQPDKETDLRAGRVDRIDGTSEKNDRAPIIAGWS
jgi:hypothetical protein